MGSICCSIAPPPVWGGGDARTAKRLAATCEFLIEQGIPPGDVVMNQLELSPAFLCAWFGGNVQIMKQLLAHGGMTTRQFPQSLEFSLEPHQRSGEPFYPIADALIGHGFDIDGV